MQSSWYFQASNAPLLLDVRMNDVCKSLISIWQSEIGMTGVDLACQEGYMDLFKGKGHKLFTAAYLKLWADLVQQSYEQEIVLIDPLLDKVCHLSTGLSRQVTSL